MSLPQSRPTSRPAGPPGREGRLLEVMQIARTFTSTLQVDELLQRVLDGAIRFSGAERGFLFLKQGSALVRWSPRPDDRTVVQVSQSVAEEVARTGRPVRRDDLAGGGGSVTDSIVRLRLMSILCLPLQVRQEVIGVIYLDSRRSWTQGGPDIDLLEALAGLAAVAIDNQRLVEERLRAERTLALGRTARALVHDLRSPLAAIRALAERLHARSKPDDAARRGLESIMNEADRLADLASDLLRFGGGAPPLRRDPVPLADLATRILEPLRPRLDAAGIVVVTSLDGGAVARGDASRLGRVLHNLLANAQEAMPRGGTLTVSCAATQGRTTLAVADTGCGMSDAVRERLFEPFFTHGKEHGTGLGLALARAIVEEHGGRIQATSAPDRGSIFTIDLPAGPS